MKNLSPRFSVPRFSVPRLPVRASRALILFVCLIVAFPVTTTAQSPPNPHTRPLSFLGRKSRSTSTTTTDTGAYNMNAPIIPDSRLTPGAVLPVTVQDIAVPGYTKKVRNVPQAIKEEYEIDHLISLELGGSNSIKNLWPQSYKTQPWDARVKDQLENKLHDMIVSGQINMGQAQHEIATDWIGAYKKYVSPVPPSGSGRSGGFFRRRSRSSRSRPDSAAGAGSPVAPSSGSGVQVWVNTKTGVYHLRGSRYYGTTAQGKYLSESAAIAEGDRAAAN